MKNLKKIFTIFIAMLILLVSGCSKNNTNLKANKDKINVVATIFPLYDWVVSVANGNPSINVELLVKNGVDLHSFQPSAKDILNLSSADVLIYVGGESDFWIEDVLKNPINKNITKINLMDFLKDSVKQEEFVDGMTQHEHNSKEEESEEYDEHIWLSIKNAENCVTKIAEELCAKSLEDSKNLNENKEKYINELKNLKKEYQEKNQFLKTIIVCDRFPFRYMTDELGINYFAAFVGCSAETEASFETVAFLSEKVKSLNVKEVFVTESSDKKLAETIIKNAGAAENCKIVSLNSMQNVGLKQIESGKTYISIMEENYKKLLSE